MRFRGLLVIGVVVAIGIALGVGVLAKPVWGAIISKVVARVTVNEPITIQTSQPSDFVVQKLIFHPGEATAWHTHPGPTIVAVVEGRLVLTQANCTSETFQAGQGFFQPAGEVHMAKNPSARHRTVVWASYVLPVGAPISTTVTNPGCP